MTVPASWAAAKLEDLVSVVRGRATPQADPTAAFIGMDNVEPHTMRLLGTVPASTMRSSAVRFEPGDVLYGRLRPYLNKVISPQFSGLASAEFIPLTPKTGVEGDFIRYRLNAADFVVFASHLDEGDRPRVDWAGISAFPVLVPPSGEPQRIVSALDSHLSRLDAAVASLEQAQSRLKAYRAAVLKAAVEGRLVPTEAELARQEGRHYEPASVLLERILAERRRRWEEAERARLTRAGKAPKDGRWKAKYREPVKPDAGGLPLLPEGWCWTTIEQLSSDEPNSLCDGPFGSNLKTSHYTAEGPRVVRLQNIGDGVFVDARAHISPEHFERLRKHEVRAGDIVVASLGADLPRACLVPQAIGPAIVKADCLRFKVNHQLANPSYVLSALNSVETRKRVKHVVHGVGRPRMGLRSFRELPLPLPPRQEQESIVLEVDRQQSLLSSLEGTSAAQGLRCSRLRQAMLKWAFKGKLVDQDPADEPADLLLARIRAERTPAARRTHKRRHRESRS